MNRRRFFGVATIGAAAAALSMKARGADGFYWTAKCCQGHESTQWVDVGSTIKVGNQCPECLAVLDLEDLGKKIKSFRK